MRFLKNTQVNMNFLKKITKLPFQTVLCLYKSQIALKTFDGVTLGKRTKLFSCGCS